VEAVLSGLTGGIGDWEITMPDMNFGVSSE